LAAIWQSVQTGSTAKKRRALPQLLQPQPPSVFICLNSASEYDASANCESGIMVKGILYKYLLEAILGVLIALILYGVFSVTSLAIILILFVGLRFLSLAAEALRKSVAAERWEKMLGEFTSRTRNSHRRNGPVSARVWSARGHRRGGGSICPSEQPARVEKSRLVRHRRRDVPIHVHQFSGH
jgi:hypothetical protein